MRSEFFLQARARVLWVAVACAGALAAAFACSSGPSDIHETDEVKGKECIACHAGAYNAAVNPMHVGRMPQTCQDCHDTKAWTPSSVTDHHWWPLQNKHVGVSCVACHTKGFKLGDTPTDCLGCHRKDYEKALNPNAGFPKHVANGVNQYPLDCKMCHADTGWKLSPWKHLADFPPGIVRGADGGLMGGHTIAPCAGCHTGNAPKYKGAPNDSDCYRCHKADADVRAVAKLQNHTAFPHTCLNCHLMSGWAQGPPLTGSGNGLHPTEKFWIDSRGKHAAPILCLDCHKLEKSAFGLMNVDCVNCHVGGDHHVSPAIDAVHLNVGNYAKYVGTSSTNFCLECHAQGQYLDGGTD